MIIDGGGVLVMVTILLGIENVLARVGGKSGGGTRENMVGNGAGNADRGGGYSNREGRRKGVPWEVV